MKKLKLAFFLILLLLSTSIARTTEVSKSSYYQTLLESRANLGNSGFTSLNILRQRLNQNEFSYNFAGAGLKPVSPLLPAGTSKAISLLGDFRVNEENYSATFSQRRPDIALFKDGSFVSVWQDERNGDRDLFCQKINSSGSTVSSNLKIVADARHTDQLEPSISRALDSNLVLVWVDGAELNIYGQRYSPDLSTVGDTFRINDSDIPNSAFEPEVRSFTDGSFVTAWVDISTGNNLYARRYNSSETLLVRASRSTARLGSLRLNHLRFPLIKTAGSQLPGRIIETWMRISISRDTIPLVLLQAVMS